ncbi:MAG: hypothetical protein SFU25_04190 [Candidatus Caenarcaniphilales bacterium]|nr:hypothetical protein [Candidatus Caenarcaniphilales bacterium]
MMKKILLSISLLGLLVGIVPAQKAEANTARTLGIVGTALGGSALALGVWNTASLYRRGYWGNGGFGGGYGYGSYYPVSYGGWGGGYGAGWGNGFGGGYYPVSYGGWGGAYGAGWGNGGYGGYGYSSYVPNYYGAFGGYGGYQRWY